jgi:hypothetical protein
MIRVNVALALFLFFGAAPATPQTKPDFSGTWVLDVARSSISPAPATPITPETLVVSQSETELKYERRSDGTSTSQIILLDYPQTMRGSSGAMMGIRANWKGDSLVLTGFSETGRKSRAQNRQPLPSLVPPPDLPELNRSSILVWSLSDGGRVLTLQGAAVLFFVASTGERVSQATNATWVYLKQ